MSLHKVSRIKKNSDFGKKGDSNTDTENWETDGSTKEGPAKNTKTPEEMLLREREEREREK